MSSSPAVTAAPALDTARREATRRRLVGVLVGGVALGSTGHIAAVTVTSLVAQSITGDRSMAGVPAAVVVLGAALGATTLAALMARRGRRHRAGRRLCARRRRRGDRDRRDRGVCRSRCCCSGRCSSASATAPTSSRAMPPPTSYPPDRRASAIGTVVWAATIGAVIGPNLVEPIRRGRDDHRACRRSAGRTSCRSSSSAIAGLIVVRVPPPRSLRDRRPNGGPGRGRRHVCADGHDHPAAHRGAGDHGARHRPVRDGPDHDDDAAPHDRPSPLAARRSGS